MQRWECAAGHKACGKPSAATGTRHDASVGEIFQHQTSETFYQGDKQLIIANAEVGGCTRSVFLKLCYESEQKSARPAHPPSHCLG
jgi:hypothetical protein